MQTGIQRIQISRTSESDARVRGRPVELIAQYNRDMSESIESRDSIWILQRALGHLKAQGKNVSNDDDVFELQMHAINVFRGMRLTAGK